MNKTIRYFVYKNTYIDVLIFDNLAPEIKKDNLIRLNILNKTTGIYEQLITKVEDDIKSIKCNDNFSFEFVNLIDYQ